MSDSDDDTPPRARRPRSHWGDEERVAAGRGRRTPAHGVPITIEDRGEFTPVTDLLDSIDDPAQRRLFRLIWEHTANQEMRYQKRVDDSDAAKLRADFAAHQEECLRFKIDLVGKNDDDGRIGEIRKSLHSLLRLLRWLVGVAVGAIGGAVFYVAVISRDYGDLETEVHALRDRVQLVESAAFFHRYAPALMPGKDSP